MVEHNCCCDAEATIKFLGLYEFIRQIVSSSLIVMYTALQSFNLMYLQAVINFFIFLPQTTGIFIILYKFEKLDEDSKAFTKYYKLKFWFTCIWVLELITFLLLRIIFNIDMPSLIVEYTFSAIGLGIDLLFILCLRRIYLAIKKGESFKPANIGIKIKVENAQAANSNAVGFAFEATIITEVNSVPVQNFKNDQEIEPNSSISVNDFTVKNDTSSFNQDIEEIRIK